MHKVEFCACSFLHALLYIVRELEATLEVWLNKDLCIMLSAIVYVRHSRKIMPASSIYRQMYAVLVFWGFYKMLKRKRIN